MKEAICKIYLLTSILRKGLGLKIDNKKESHVRTI